MTDRPSGDTGKLRLSFLGAFVCSLCSFSSLFKGTMFLFWMGGLGYDKFQNFDLKGDDQMFLMRFFISNSD